MPWSGFATWGDVASASMIVGVSWVLGLGGAAMFLTWGWSHFVGLYKTASQI